MLRSSFEKIGRVMDISINGLSFIYLSAEGKDEYPLQVDIFLTENGYHLYRIPCRIVYDHQIIKDKTEFASKYRRCGLSFEELTEKKENELKRFLKNNNMGTVNDNGVPLIQIIK